MASNLRPCYTRLPEASLAAAAPSHWPAGALITLSNGPDVFAAAIHYEIWLIISPAELANLKAYISCTVMMPHVAEQHMIAPRPWPLHLLWPEGGARPGSSCVAGRSESASHASAFLLGWTNRPFVGQVAEDGGGDQDAAQLYLPPTNAPGL